MEHYGRASALVSGLVDRAAGLSLDEAADLYRARAARLLTHGLTAERTALHDAHRSARSAGLEIEYEAARHAAATAWRHALPGTNGPWLVVGEAIANAAGALAINEILDDKTFQALVGPWRQAIGTLIPVGPGLPNRERLVTR